MKLPIGRLAKIAAPAAIRTVQPYYSTQKSDRAVEFQNWIIIILTGAVLYYNVERVRLSRINNYQNAKNSKTTNEVLDELKKINSKLGECKNE